MRVEKGWRDASPDEFPRGTHRSHTYCPPCLEVTLAALELELRARREAPTAHSG